MYDAPNVVNASEVGGIPERKCAVASCNSPSPDLYDDHLEQYYCDVDCLAEYICENPEQIAEWYARMNIHVIKND